MASTSGSKIPEPAGLQPAAAAAAAASVRECESCRSAPGIPFCRVEWSFLCTGCAAVVHRHHCVVSVPPNANLNANFPHLPYYPHPYHYPYPYANPSTDPNAVVHLSSEEDDLSPAHPDALGKGWHQIPGRATTYRRLESVMRYREKRKSRKFDKTVRYENRRAYAELRPRLDGKFAPRKDGGGDEAAAELPDIEVGVERVDQASVRPDPGANLVEMVAGGIELENHDFVEDARFQ